MNTETKYLSELRESKAIIDLFTDIYDESNYGFILDFNDEFLLLEAIDDDSKPNGLMVFYRENITRIRWGGNDITSTYKLIDQSRRIHDLKPIDLSAMPTILRSIQDIFGYVTVHIQDADNSVCFIGEVESLDEEALVLYEYGSKSALDRKRILLKLRDITKVEGGGSYEEGLKQLFKD